MSPSHFHGMYSDTLFFMGLFPVSLYRYTHLSTVEVKVLLSTTYRHKGGVEE
jgi:hypothetical protein